MIKSSQQRCSKKSYLWWLLELRILKSSKKVELGTIFCNNELFDDATLNFTLTSIYF